MMRVGFSGSDHWGERTGGAQGQENKGRSESEGGAGGGERCEIGKECDLVESCAQGRDEGIEAGKVAIRWKCRVKSLPGKEDDAGDEGSRIGQGWGDVQPAR